MKPFSSFSHLPPAGKYLCMCARCRAQHKTLQPSTACLEHWLSFFSYSSPFSSHWKPSGLRLWRLLKIRRVWEESHMRQNRVSHLMNSGSNNIPHMGQIDGDGCLDSDLPWMHIISGTYYVFEDRERRDGKVGRNSGAFHWWRCLTSVAGSTRASLSQEHPFRHKKHPLPPTIKGCPPSPCIAPSTRIVCRILPIIITIIFASA